MSRPFAQVFALYAACSARYGVKAGGLTYTERAVVRALRSSAE
jgi:hypothetical protein